MFYAISYDVRDDRRRTDVARILKDYGCRVQYSVFEANLEPLQLGRLKERMERVLDTREDSLRIYPLCGSCVDRVLVFGEGEVSRDPDVIVL